ncbi:glycosyl hydrolase [Geobacter sulfurreducens]|uniref:glycosyl hydrolase n=1 Tax=Geobacter sulfurreducens TaxID=35554 RepID=UPI000DBB7C45|nr:glycosyl hydrolase [Geobacter sulfurreducens]BBA70345.1 hypothetical protein YM18_1823 [Geobacter sulfurreducens]
MKALNRYVRLATVFTLLLVFYVFYYPSNANTNDVISVKIYPNHSQQTLIGWGGNIYPFPVDDDFMKYLLTSLPVNHLRIFSDFPDVPGEIEDKFLSYINSKGINIILNFRLNDRTLTINDLPKKICDYIEYLNRRGMSVRYLTLNEPDAKLSSKFTFDNYVSLVKLIKLELLHRNLSTEMVGPDTATPNGRFIERLAEVGALSYFKAIAYHSYEYKGLDGFADIANTAKLHDKPVWITEQNYDAVGSNMYSNTYAANNIRNLFWGINKGNAELCLFFSFAWGRDGGVVLFDRGKKVKPIFYELQKVFNTIPKGSVVLKTDSEIPVLAVRYNNKIIIMLYNDQNNDKNVRISIGERQVLRSIKGMTMDIITY